jgi:large repetitive protein
MTSVSGLPPDERPVEVTVASAAVAPGTTELVAVTLTNAAGDARSFTVAVDGFDASWTEVPSQVGPIAAGETATLDLRVHVPVGHPASHLVGVVSVQASEPVSGHPLGPPVRADLELTVGDGNLIRAALEPVDVPGRRRGRFLVVLQNRGAEPIRVDLSPVTPDAAMTVGFDVDSQVLTPGGEARVPAVVRAPRPVTGQDGRRPFGVRVQGRTTPVLLEGAMIQPPVIGSRLLKAAVFLVVLALWVAVAAVGIRALDNHLKKTATSRAIASQPPAPSASPSGSGTASGSGSGSGSGAGGSGSGSGSGAGGSGTASGTAAPTTTVSGKVGGASPGAATVSISPQPLVPPSSVAPDAAAASDVFQTGSIGRRPVELVADRGDNLIGRGPIGKIPAGLVADTVSAPGSPGAMPTHTTLTGPDGFWSIAGVPAPGYYLVTISKPGFSTRKYVISTTVKGGPLTVSATLTAATGSISGTIRDSSGARLGGVAITITDGTVSFKTSTPTIGDVGSWQVSGLNTPDTYLVTAAEPGYGTQTTLVQVGPAASASGVNLTMTPGVGSIMGTVTSPTYPNGLGGVTVTATDGTVTQRVTTTTASPMGHFALRNLPIPGTYAVTVSGEGWLSVTEQVQLNGTAVINVPLRASTATVQGLIGVVGVVTGNGLPNAGVTLSNSTYTFKTPSVDSSVDHPAGFYQFADVPPGQYLLTAEEYKYTNASTQVTVAAGDVKNVFLNLPYVGPPNLATGTITGTVRSLANFALVDGSKVTLDGGSATTTVDGTYTFQSVPPGIHQVTATGGTPAGTTGGGDLGSGSVSVTVPLGATAPAPLIELPPLSEVTGTVVRDDTGAGIDDASVSLCDQATQQICTKPVPTTGPPSGTYTINDVSPGFYVLKVTVPDGLYQPPSAPIPVQVPDYSADQGMVQVPPVKLQFLGFTVVTLGVQSDGSIVPLAGTQVSVSGFSPPPAISGPPGSAQPTATVGPVVSGKTYTVTFAGDKNHAGWTAPPLTFVGGVDRPTQTVYLSLPLPTPSAILEYPYMSYMSPSGLIECPVSSSPNNPACPSVPSPPPLMLKGTFSTPSGPAEQSVTVSQPGPDGSYSFAGLTDGLLPYPITFSLPDPSNTFQTPPAPTTVDPTPAGWETPTIELTPIYSPVSGSVTPAAGVKVAVAPTGSASVIVNSDGSLGWSQTSPAPGQPDTAAPGQYSLTFSADSYEAKPESVSVPLCQANPCATAPVPPVTLTPLVSLEVQPCAPAPCTSPGFGTVTGAAVGTVTLFGTNGQVGPPVSLGSPPDPQEATISNVPPDDGPFTLSVAVPGYATYGKPVTLPPAGTPAIPALTPEGYVSGMVVDNNTNAGIAGAVIQAVDVHQTSSTCVPGAVPQVTSDSSGSFTIVGDPRTNNGGLCPGDTYDLNVKGPPGYGVATQQVTINFLTPTPNNATVTLAPTATHFQVSVDDTGGHPLNGVSVTSVSAAGSRIPLAPSATPGIYAASLDPARYTFSIALPGFEPLTVGPVQFSPGQDQMSIAVDLVPDREVITGTVTAQGTTVGLQGVAVNLYRAGSRTPVATAISGAGGRYTMNQLGPNPGAGAGAIPDGSYSVHAALAGYSFVAPSQSASTFTTSNPTMVQNLTLSVDPVRLAIAVASTAGADLTGAQVTITPVAPPPGASLICGTGAGSPMLQVVGGGTTQTEPVTKSGATFTEVQPDYYQVAIDTSSLPVSHPPQTAQSLLVCPGTGTAAPTVPSPASVTLDEGEVSGSVSLPGGLPASATTVAIYTGTSVGGNPVARPTLVCGSPCTGGQYSAFVPLGSSYTVTIGDAADGFATSTFTTPQLVAGAAMATFSPTLVPVDHRVEVSVTTADGAPVTVAATVTLTSDSGAPHTYTAPVVAGVATFPAVAPADYAVSFDAGPVTGPGAPLAVPVESSSNDPLTTGIAVPAGEVAGTVTVSPPPVTATSGTVRFCTDAACTSVVLTEPVSVSSAGSGSFTATLPASGGGTTYWVSIVLTGSTPTAPVSELVTDGGTTVVDLSSGG